MFKKFLNSLQSANREQSVFDPASLEDPVAMLTEWEPLEPGGSNFRTHHLAQVDTNRMEFQASWGAMLFGLAFLLIGLAVCGGFAVSGLMTDEYDSWVEPALFAGMGLLFAGIGAWLIHSFLAPIVFDKRTGAFWKGRTAPDQTFNALNLKHYAELKDIHALQLLAELVRSNKSTYTSYELNLVLSDGRRINVVDHGDRDKIAADAQALGEFLEVPVWNTIDREIHFP